MCCQDRAAAAHYLEAASNRTVRRGGDSEGCCEMRAEAAAGSGLSKSPVSAPDARQCKPELCQWAAAKGTGSRLQPEFKLDR